MIDFVIFSFLIFLSALFSSSETAFFSMSDAGTQILARTNGKSGQKVAKLRKNRHELLITILIGNNIVNLFTASYATVVAAQYFGSAALGVATGASTVAILIFGEIIPKSVAIAKKERIVLVAAWPLTFLRFIFTPAIWALDHINKIFYRLVGIRQSETGVTEEEVRATTRLGVEQGVIDYREHEMIENIFKFDDITVGGVMTPWYKVVSLSGIVPVEQIAHFISHEGKSRYPVYDGRNDDNIIGYVHVNHIMKALNSADRDQSLDHFVVPMLRVSEDTSIERIFRAMTKEKAHMFLVHEKGAKENIIGIITLEDIIEEIMGEITDETDIVPVVR